MTRACDRLASLLERLYGRVLTVYPAEFRQEYAEEMVEFFGEDCRRAARRGGMAGLLVQGIRTFWDLAASAPGVHMDVIRQDLRFAFRMLRKNPGFAWTAILTLALGIGANSAIFSLVHGILLTPPAFPDPDRLVMVWEKNPRGIDRNSVSPPNFTDYRAGSTLLSGMAAFYEESANLEGAAGSEHLLGSMVTARFFDVLGVHPLLGAGLAARPGEPDAPKVVLSYALWAERFHRDPAVVGSMLRIDGRDYSIRGVMPASFHFGSREVALWSTMPASYFQTSRQAHFLSAIGRMKPGVSLAQVRAELNTLATGLARSYPTSNRGWGVTIVPLREQIIGDIRRPLWILMAAVGFILLIACANVANLLLARGAHREGEIAIRTALGAGLVRICRQMVTESVVLAMLGAGAGLALAWGSLELLQALRPAVVPRLDELAVDGWVVAFTIGTALLTGLVCGLAPVWRISRGNLRDGLKEGGANRRSFAGHWLRGALISSEIALSLVLLVGAGLLVRTFLHLRFLDPGFQPRHATSFTVDLARRQYPTGALRAGFVERALDRVRSVPGVVSAGMISTLPLTGGEGHNRFGFTVEGRADAEDHRFYARWISPDYFASMAIPLLRGRDFSARDRAGAPAVVIVDAALAHRYFPNENPVGKFVRLSYASSVPREIVGVAGEVRQIAMEMEPAPQIYVPLQQEPQVSSVSLVVRGMPDEGAPTAAVVRVLQEIDVTLPVYDIGPVTGLVSESIAPRRFNMLLMTLLAGLALALAAVGVYGVISYLAGERLHEIGIRMALGARPWEILLLMVRQGMKHALVGIVGGLAAALILTRAMAGLLFGVTPLDGWTFAAVAGLTAAVACLACLVPAFRASSVDAARALRDRVG